MKQLLEIIRRTRLSQDRKSDVFFTHPETLKFLVKIVKVSKTRLTSSIRNENIWTKSYLSEIE